MHRAGLVARPRSKAPPTALPDFRYKISLAAQAHGGTSSLSGQRPFPITRTMGGYTLNRTPAVSVRAE
jgi:hypothetical protein